MMETLKVLLWGEEIGRLAWDTRRRMSYFTYNPEFVKRGLDIAPIIAPVKDARSHMPIWGEEDRKFQRLPAFLADSLPDDWGNQIFEFWRHEQHLSNADITPLEKLSFIGKRGMGALEFEPEMARHAVVDKIDVQSLIALAGKIFAQRENARILPEESLTMQSLIAVGTSAGGRQPKAIIAINRETGEIRSGQIAELEGFEYCIMKFGDAQYCSAELEMTYYEMATKAGIRMMPSELVTIDGKQHFMTRRFDRDGNQKLHTQTLAALFPEADSYEKLLWVCRKLRLPEIDMEEVFRRLVFNHLANNTDDHNKNFSFVMNPQGQWRLSPAYDMTYILNYGGYLPNREHCMFVGGKLCDVTKQDILRFAKENGIRRAESIIHAVAEALTQFRTFAEKNGVREEWTGRVETTLTQHLAEWGLVETTISEIFSFVDTEGRQVENLRLEQAYKGNIHLLASVGGQERKYIIRKGTEEHVTLSKTGLSRVSQNTLKALFSKYFL